MGPRSAHSVAKPTQTWTKGKAAPGLNVAILHWIAAARTPHECKTSRSANAVPGRPKAGKTLTAGFLASELHAPRGRCCSRAGRSEAGVARAGAIPRPSGRSSAAGTTRVSINFNEKHAPDFPRIETVHPSSRSVVSRAELAALGIVALSEKVASAIVHTSHQGSRGWASYQRCVDKAPEACEACRPDISRADFIFCLLAIDWC